MTNPVPVVNPQNVAWVNPTQALDQNGNTVSWDAATDEAGVELQFDGQAAVTFPTSLGATSASLKAIAAYTALAAGSHTLALAVVTKEGVAGQFAAPVTFSVATVITPFAPTNVVLA